MPSNSDTMEMAAKMLGISVEEVSQRLEKLPVDEVIDVLDDITSGNEARVKDALGDGVDENDHTRDEEEDAGDPDINPLFMKGAQKRAKKKSSRHHDDDGTPHEPNVGDDVEVGDDEGIVKFKDGPADTTGVMIDGETTMVKNDKIRRATTESRLNEGTLGVASMPDISRMRALAGIAPPSMDFAAVDLANKMNAKDSPLAPGSFAVEVEPCPEPSCDGEVVTATSAPASSFADFAPPPAAVSQEPVTSPGGIDQILAQFDEIEALLPGIVLSDVKQVRDRINKLNMRLNEGVEGRRRKV